MKKIIFLLFVWLSISFGQKVDHSILSNLMKEYNFDGNVNYKGLTTDSRLTAYLEKLSNANPQKLETKHAELAFWINVYNAFTIKAIVDNYPIESINDLHSGGRVLSYILSTTIWDEDFIKISGKEYSLNDIEHKILRKKYNEPRIHFAIVCASISCPQLRNEAFVASRIDSQLQDQTIQFFNDESKNKFDVENKVAYLSKILDWFSEDFGDNDEKVLLFVSEYVESEISENIKQNLDDWTVEYMDYNWGLNDHKIN